MSGSGGGGGGGGGDQPKIECELLAFETQLTSPKATVVAKLKPNDELQIELQSPGGTAVVAAIFESEIAGGITAQDVQRLRECLQDGYEYRATVISVKEGQVRVRVKVAQR